MPDFAHRSNELEIMDDLNCTGHVLGQTLRELEIINKWLGGNSITLHALSQLISAQPDLREITVVDLGCGSGEMLKIIEGWGKNRKVRLSLIGVDANPNIVEFAKKNLKGYPNIHVQTMNVFSEDFLSQEYDIVIGTLFYHHFSNEQLIQFFKQLKRQVRIGFVLNDIHRHWLAYYAIKFLTQIFSKSSMVKYDAPLSVLRAFRKAEIEQILEAAHIDHFLIRWKWAFRWQVVARVRKKPI